MQTIEPTDLESLPHKCHTKSAQVFLTEAIQCYRVGALRAATLSVWQAIVFDYIEKLEELASDGDKFAQNRAREFREYERTKNVSKLLEFERNILKDLCQELQFISLSEQLDLKRIQEDRNRCSHLTFTIEVEPYAPNPETVRAHLVTASQVLLSQPPTHGKAALESILSFFTASHFPEEDTVAIARLKKTKLGTARRSLVNNLVKVLLKKGFESDYQESSLWFHRLHLTSCIHRTAVLDCISKDCEKVFAQAELNDTFHKILLLLGESPETFDLLAPHYKNEAIRGLPTIISREITFRILIPGLLRVASLKESIFSNLESISDENVEEIYNITKEPKLLEEIVDRYSKSSSYSLAGDRGRSVIRNSAQLSPAQKERLVEAFSKNRQIRNYMNGTDVIDNLFVHDHLDKDSLIELREKYGVADAFSNERLEALEARKVL